MAAPQWNQLFGHGPPPSDDEPKGWPLKRRLATNEWYQVVKAMVLRRVPDARSIAEHTLNEFVQDDIRATIDSGRLYVDRFDQVRHVYAGKTTTQLIKDGLIRRGIVGYVETAPSVPIHHIFRTEATQEYLDMLPRHIVAVLDFFPVTNELEFLASLLPEDELPNPPPPAAPTDPWDDVC
jgi:hypothetical protein